MFLVDWLSFTTKIDSVNSVIELLGLTSLPFEEMKGLNGYSDSYFYNGIRINLNGHNDNMGVFVDMSGTGCRTFETYTTTDFDTIFTHIISYDGYNATRLDVAFDDKEGIIPIKKLASDTLEGNFVSKFHDWDAHYSSKGLTVYQGSAKSDIMLRIYDKARERKVDGHWIRVEMQLRQDRAGEFIRQYVAGRNLGDLFCGVLQNYVRYVKPSDTDSNKQRWSMRKYWQKLVNNAVKVKLFTRCDLEYNLENLERFVVKQAGGAIQTYIDILGVDELQKVLLKRKNQLNPKYERLKKEFGQTLKIKKVAAQVEKPIVHKKMIKCECCHVTKIYTEFTSYRGDFGLCRECSKNGMVFDEKYKNADKLTMLDVSLYELEQFSLSLGVDTINLDEYKPYH